MDTIRVTAELIFETSLDRTRVVRIPDPAVGVTQAVVTTAVNRLLSAQPFDETIGQLEDFVRADRVTVSRVPLLPE